MGRRPAKTPEEESGLFELIKKVKYKNDEKSYDKVCVYMKPYIDHFCRQFLISGLGCDDIEQECLFALRYKAVNDFDPKRGTFKTFAVLCIRRHLYSIIKGGRQNKKRVLNISVSIDETHSDDELSLKNIIQDGSETADEYMERRELETKEQERLINELSDLERDVFVLYKKKYRYDEIVDILRDRGRDVDKKSIDNSCQRIKSKARNLFKKNNDL